MTVLRLLVLLLPSAFRREFGNEILDTVAALWRTQRRSPGWRPTGWRDTIIFWIGQWAAVLRAAVSLRTGRGVLGGADVRPNTPKLNRRLGHRASSTLHVRQKGVVMQGLLRDLRHAARGWRRRPGFAIVTTLTLALGVGATTAMFSVVHGVLLRTLPYEEADRIVVLRQVDTRDGSLAEGVSAINLRDLADRTETLIGASLAHAHGVSLLDEGRATSLRGWMVSTGFFEAIGARPAIGRAFDADAYRPGGPRVVILGHRAWQMRYGGDPEVVGRQIVLDDASHTVVGVMAEPFAYPTVADFLMPRPPMPMDEDARGRPRHAGLARLAPGVTLADARHELSRIATDLESAHPEANAYLGFRPIGLETHLLGNVRTPLRLLLGAVVLVLLIAAANVAALFLARGAERTREYALRGAMGASRGSLIRLVMADSLILAVLGGTLGIGLAFLGTDVIRGLAPDHWPRVETLRVDGTVLVVALVTALGSAVLSGIAPAIQANRGGLRARLGEGARGSAGGRRLQSARDRLVILEIALALILAIAAGLLVRSFDRVLDNELGFSADGRLVAQVFAFDDDHAPDLAFFDRARDAIRMIPGVKTVGLTTGVPLADGDALWAGVGTIRFTVAGNTNADGPRTVASTAIDGAYPAAIGIPVVAGRTFDRRDAQDAMPVAMVNERFVARHLPAGPALGQRITLVRNSLAGKTLMGDAAEDADASTIEIVGVLADVRRTGFESAPRPEIYRPIDQVQPGARTFVVQTTGDPASLTAAVREAIWSADPNQPIWAIRPLPQMLDDWTRQRRFNTFLLVAFAALALLLAAVGIYGLMSYVVEQQTVEIGIRRALGGQRRDLLALVVRRGLRLAMTGVAIGLSGALLVTRLLQGMLYGIGPFDVLTFSVLSVMVIGVAVLAALGPAHRATRVDPMDALRAD